MMPNPSLEPEIELVCSQCGYRTMRKAGRLRRETELLCPNCGAVIVPEIGERDDDVKP